MPTAICPTEGRLFSPVFNPVYTNIYTLYKILIYSRAFFTSFLYRSVYNNYFAQDAENMGKYII
jgi:hypothetical protein